MTWVEEEDMGNGSRGRVPFFGDGQCDRDVATRL